MTSFWRSRPEEVSVYVVTNTINGKQYVGYTNGLPEKRWSSHKTVARKGSPWRFHQALRKHGEGAFEWRVVSTHATDTEAKQAERDLIAQLRPRYNMTEGGDGTGPATEERKEKVRANWADPEKRERYVAARRAAKGCGVGPRRPWKVSEEGRKGLLKSWQDPQRRINAAEASKENWRDPDVRERRTSGLQAAAKLIDQEARGRKIAEAKRAPEKVEMARVQSKARVAADGGAQIRAAQAARWSKPGARERASINALLKAAEKRGELQLWL